MMARPRLEVSDPLGRRVVLIDKPTLTIGRRAGNDVHLTGSDVSRDHAQIVAINGRHVLRDHGSSAGTFVNGEPVKERVLSHGDRVHVGSSGTVELVFLVEEATHVQRAAGGGELRQVGILLDALRAMGSGRVLDEVLALVLDSAIEVTGAERGFIMLADKNGALDMKLARAQGKVTLPKAGFTTSRKIPQEVFETGQQKIVADLSDRDLAEAHQGTLALGIRHVLCTPLRLVRYLDSADAASEPRNIGVLSLDSREKGTLLLPATQTALETLAAEAAVAIENARLYRETVEKTRIDQELRMASTIQQALLPSARKAAGFFDAMGASIPCRAIGGDFFDYLDLADKRVGFALGDVSGKGPPAALLTAMIQGILAAHALTSMDARAMMMAINRGLLLRAIRGRFATAFFAILDRDGTLVCSNAGHNPPMLFGKRGMRRLETGGMPLGLFETAEYEQESVTLDPGDTLLVFSDGVSEALTAAGEEFGDRRIQDVVTSLLCETPETILHGLLDAVGQFTNGAVQNDDITAVVVRYTP
jgi:serine phosphatase RsbU (regulator of sigma subunit)/pSer/pThr/pTyr-binding forkhead associated (FHA) protein